MPTEVIIAFGLWFLLALPAWALVAAGAMADRRLAEIMDREAEEPEIRPDFGHADPDCCGMWLHDMTGGLLLCTRCRVRLIATGANLAAAARESAAGIAAEEAADSYVRERALRGRAS